MALLLFDSFKAFLTQLLSDPDVRRKNYVLQDPAYLADMTARVESLTADVSLPQDYSNALTPSLGMLSKDVPSRSLKFRPKGFANYLSSFREGSVSNPARFWKLPDTDPHGARYLLADQGTGVLLLNSNLEVLFRFPGYGPIATGVEYNDPSAVCTWTDTISGTTYLAVALYSHHIVQIYQYTAPFTWLGTIGLLDTPGDTPNYCYNPQGLAVDPTTSTLYIINENGTPPGATLDRGYISRYNVAAPAVPVHLDTPYYYSTTGRLLDNQVTYPSDAYFDAASNLLWVSNFGANEVGAINVSSGTLQRYLEPAGSGYVFREPNQVVVQNLLGGYSRIFVANGATGSIEEFDGATLQHLTSYGVRSSSDELSGYNRFSTEVYGAIGYARAVIADTIWLEGQEADVFVVGDTLNRRLARFNTSAYSDQNFVNFELLELQVPVSINGWTISGDIPLDMVSVQYRCDETETFRDLPQQAVIPPTSSVQFRIVVQLDPEKFVKTWTITQLRVYATQA